MAERSARRECVRQDRAAHSPAGARQPGRRQSVGGGLHELRIDYGRGYRVYFVYQGSAVVILLCGGDKATQDRDIKKARTLAGE
jgi:putative addiction module killer protein